MTACVNFGIANGATLVVLPRFEIHSLLQAIDRYQPTLFPGMPTMYIAVNSRPETSKHNIKSIRYCISGAAPLPVDVSQKIETLTGGYLVVSTPASNSPISPVRNSPPWRKII